jgi:cyclophilin family peptidyl-prolyl cis-trans isomerase
MIDHFTIGVPMKTTMNIINLSLMLITLSFTTQFAGAQSVVMTNQEPKVTHVVIMNTNHGAVTLSLYGEDAPKTVENFVGLAEQKFYDGILFHRVVPGFVIQAGDPKTKDEALKAQWGTGGESIYGGDFVDELNPNAKSFQIGYAKGVLAMANRGPNTNTSQFFICLEDLGLPKNYTMYGKVTEGMDIVAKIAAVPLNGSTPREPVIITSMKVKKKS